MSLNFIFWLFFIYKCQERRQSSDFDFCLTFIYVNMSKYEAIFFFSLFFICKCQEKWQHFHFDFLFDFSLCRYVKMRDVFYLFTFLYLYMSRKETTIVFWLFVWLFFMSICQYTRFTFSFHFSLFRNVKTVTYLPWLYRFYPVRLKSKIRPILV